MHPIDWQHFTPYSALAGGVLIGLAASVLLAFNGRVAGITGILAGVLMPTRGEVTWRMTFLVGLLIGGLGMQAFLPERIGESVRSLGLVAAAGLVVGVGTRLGNGCTSGHGVCGISRFWPRSMVATLIFMATGAITVVAVRLAGGAS
ncbi:MAG: YeeE/YedE thiosulfate transporter family protein [Polyangiales bacterium]